MNRIALFGLVLACLVAVGGCRRGSKSEKTYDLSPDKIVVADLPSSKGIVAEFTSKDNVPITAYLVKEEEATAALNALNEGKSIMEAIGKTKPAAEQTKLANGTLRSPKTDSSTKWSILLTTNKATSVTVKTRNE